MTEEQKKQLTDCGVAVDEALNRFMGQADIYVDFLGKSLQNPAIAQLHKSVEEQDATQAFECAHMLKGVAANLSLKRLLETIDPMVETLREGSLDGVEEHINVFEEECRNLKNVLDQF